jgi:hypothetical protein
MIGMVAADLRTTGCGKIAGGFTAESSGKTGIETLLLLCFQKQNWYGDD